MNLTGQRFTYIEAYTGQQYVVITDDEQTITYTALDGIDMGKPCTDTKEYLITRVQFENMEPLLVGQSELRHLTDEDLVLRLREIRAQRANIGSSVKTQTKRRIKKASDALLREGNIDALMSASLQILAKKKEQALKPAEGGPKDAQNQSQP